MGSRSWTAMAIVVIIATSAVGIPAAPAADGEPSFPSVWLVDDGTDLTYNVSLDGVLTFSFPTPRNAVSSIALDPTDRSFWGANDGATSRLVNYTYEIVDGAPVAVVLQEILSSEFGAVGSEGVAVTFDPADDTLWVVDDPLVSSGIEPAVYNITKDGTLISSFPATIFDENIRSPQAIAYDAFTGTLWITDNSTDLVYNVATDGTLLSSLDVETLLGVDNIQGSAVESADVIWLTARDTGTVYRMSKDGTLLGSFSMSGVDPAAANPTGVAFDAGPALIELGEASAFAILGLPGAKLKLDHLDQATGVVGDVGLGGGAKQDFSEGLLTGVFFVDPAGENDHAHDVVISGGVASADLSSAVSSALALATASAALPADFTFGDLKSTTIVTGAPGRNVVSAKKVELDGNETLTLQGFPSSVFIVNIAESIKLKDESALQLTGGVLAENVLINLVGDGDSAIESGSSATATILAPAAKMKIKDPGSFLLGAIIGGNEIKLEKGGRLRAFGEALPPGPATASPGSAMIALPGAKAKLKDTPSVVQGDVLLGPAAEQDFDKGRIEGALVVDPAADNTHGHNVEIVAGTVVAELSRTVADFVDRSAALARLAPTQTFAEITNTRTITGDSGLNVIASKKIELDNGETLTLTGDATTVFVFNLAEKLKLKNGSAIVLAEGLPLGNVLYNIRGGVDSAIESGSVGRGTILAPYADKVKVKGAGSVAIGAIVGGGELIVESGGLLDNALPPVPVLAQANFRVRDDSVALGSDDGWLGTLNESVTVPAESTFRLRFEIEETDGTVADAGYMLQYRKNGGAWTNLPTTRPLDESDRTATNGVESWVTAQYAPNEATTDVLAGSALPFVPGAAVEAPANTSALPLLQNQHTELEWAVRIHKLYDGRSTNAEGDTFEFRVTTGDGVALDSYASSALVTLDWPDGLVGGTYIESPHQVGPFRDGNGNLYFPVEYAETDAEWVMLKSSDGGATWTPVDEAGAPTSGDLESVDIQQVGDTLHILHTGGSTAALDVRYYTFFMSDHATAPDSWDVDELVAGDLVAGDQSSSLAVLSDGRVRAFFRYASAGFDRIGYRTRSVAGTWDAVTTDIDVEAVDFTDVVAVPSQKSGDLVHVFYNDNTNGNLYYRSLAGDNTLSSRLLLAPGSQATTGTGTQAADEQPIVPPVTWVSGADDVVMVGYRGENPAQRLRAAVVENGAQVSNRRWSDHVPAQDRGTSSQPVADLANDGSTVYGLYADASTPDQVFSDVNVNDTSWGTDVLRFVNPNDDFGWIRGNVFTHGAANGGAKVYGFVYDQGNESGDVGFGTGYIFYDELDLPPA